MFYGVVFNRCFKSELGVRCFWSFADGKDSPPNGCFIGKLPFASCLLYTYSLSGRRILLFKPDKNLFFPYKIYK